MNLNKGKFTVVVLSRPMVDIYETLRLKSIEAKGQKHNHEFHGDILHQAVSTLAKLEKKTFGEIDPAKAKRLIANLWQTRLTWPLEYSKLSEKYIQVAKPEMAFDWKTGHHLVATAQCYAADEFPNLEDSIRQEYEEHLTEMLPVPPRRRVEPKVSIGYLLRMMELETDENDEIPNLYDRLNSPDFTQLNQALKDLQDAQLIKQKKRKGQWSINWRTLGLNPPITSVPSHVPPPLPQERIMSILALITNLATAAGGWINEKGGISKVLENQGLTKNERRDIRNYYLSRGWLERQGVSNRIRVTEKGHEVLQERGGEVKALGSGALTALQLLHENPKIIYREYREHGIWHPRPILQALEAAGLVMRQGGKAGPGVSYELTDKGREVALEQKPEEVPSPPPPAPPEQEPEPPAEAVAIQPAYSLPHEVQKADEAIARLKKDIKDLEDLRQEYLDKLEDLQKARQALIDSSQEVYTQRRKMQELLKGL